MFYLLYHRTGPWMFYILGSKPNRKEIKQTKFTRHSHEFFNLINNSYTIININNIITNSLHFNIV